MRWTTSLLLATITVARCGVVTSPSRHGQAVSIARFGEGTPYTYYSGVRDSMRVVIRDSTDWRRYWAAINGPMRPPPPLPEVDFARSVVVVAAMGQRSSGGYSITLDSAYRTRQALRIVVVRRLPGSGCVLTATRTAPVDVGRVEDVPDSVVFIERSEVEGCKP